MTQRADGNFSADGFVTATTLIAALELNIPVFNGSDPSSVSGDLWIRRDLSSLNANINGSVVRFTAGGSGSLNKVQQSNPTSQVFTSPTTLSFDRSDFYLKADSGAQPIVHSVRTGTLTGGQNLGIGTAVFAGTVGPLGQFNTLVAGSNITITLAGGNITIASSAGGSGTLSTIKAVNPTKTYASPTTFSVNRNSNFYLSSDAGGQPVLNLNWAVKVVNPAKTVLNPSLLSFNRNSGFYLSTDKQGQPVINLTNFVPESGDQNMSGQLKWPNPNNTPPASAYIDLATKGDGPTDPGAIHPLIRITASQGAVPDNLSLYSYFDGASETYVLSYLGTDTTPLTKLFLNGFATQIKGGAANNSVLTLNATELKFAGNQLKSALGGLAANPDFSFLNDPTTGMFQPAAAAGVLGFAVSGVGIVQINPRGVQISQTGTFDAVPEADLDVHGSIRGGHITTGGFYLFGGKELVDDIATVGNISVANSQGAGGGRVVTLTTSGTAAGLTVTESNPANARRLFSNVASLKFNRANFYLKADSQGSPEVNFVATDGGTLNLIKTGNPPVNSQNFAGPNTLTFDRSDFYLKADSAGQPVVHSVRTGTITGAANLGTGQPVFAATVGPTLQFNSIAAGNNIGIALANGTITITNTASAGTGSLSKVQQSNPTSQTFTNPTTLSFDRNDFYLKADSGAQPTVHLTDNGLITGAVNLGSPSGAGGSAAVFAGQAGTLLQFNQLTSDTTGLTITTSNGVITFHNAIGGTVNNVRMSSGVEGCLNPTTINFSDTNFYLTQIVAAQQVKVNWRGPNGTMNFVGTENPPVPSQVFQNPFALYFDRTDFYLRSSVVFPGNPIVHISGHDGTINLVTDQVSTYTRPTALSFNNSQFYLSNADPAGSPEVNLMPTAIQGVIGAMVYRATDLTNFLPNANVDKPLTWDGIQYDNGGWFSPPGATRANMWFKVPKNQNVSFVRIYAQCPISSGNPSGVFIEKNGHFQLGCPIALAGTAASGSPPFISGFSGVIHNVVSPPIPVNVGDTFYLSAYCSSGGSSIVSLHGLASFAIERVG